MSEGRQEITRVYWDMAFGHITGLQEEWKSRTWWGKTKLIPTIIIYPLFLVAFTPTYVAVWTVYYIYGWLPPTYKNGCDTAQK